MNRMTGEEFLQSKDIWNHPTLTDRNNKECYDVAELLEEYATGEPKRKPLSDGVLPLTDEELVCIKEMTGAVFALGVKIVYSHLEYVLPNGHFDTKCVESLKAILWLAERFNLTGEK